MMFTLSVLLLAENVLSDNVSGTTAQGLGMVDKEKLNKMGEKDQVLYLTKIIERIIHPELDEEEMFAMDKLVDDVIDKLEEEEAEESSTQAADEVAEEVSTEAEEASEGGNLRGNSLANELSGAIAGANLGELKKLRTEKSMSNLKNFVEDQILDKKLGMMEERLKEGIEQKLEGALSATKAEESSAQAAEAAKEVAEEVSTEAEEASEGKGRSLINADFISLIGHISRKIKPVLQISRPVIDTILLVAPEKIRQKVNTALDRIETGLTIAGVAGSTVDAFSDISDFFSNLFR